MKLIQLLVNYLLKGTTLMATIEEVEQTVSELVSTLTAVDGKLDEIKAYIDSIPSGTVVTQEQLDSLASILSSAKEQAQAVLAEADGLDGTKPA